MAMNSEIKQKWLAALRSGKYGQAKAALRVKENFCCLGVLCDVLGAEWQQPSDDSANNSDMIPHLNGVNASVADILSGKTLTIVGFDDRIETELVNMNDNGRTFGEIADWIEEYL